MWLPTKKQVDTATRYMGVIVATSFTIFGLQAKGFDLSQAQRAITQLGETANTLVILAAGLVALYNTARGVNAASPTNQIASVKLDAANGSQDAKAALLDAAASLPEVVDPIHVTDQSLVDKTTSDQVVKAGG